MRRVPNLKAVASLEVELFFLFFCFFFGGGGLEPYLSHKCDIANGAGRWVGWG